MKRFAWMLNYMNVTQRDLMWVSWRNPADASDHEEWEDEPPCIETVGWVVALSDTHVVLCQSFEGLEPDGIEIIPRDWCNDLRRISLHKEPPTSICDTN